MSDTRGDRIKASEIREIQELARALSTALTAWPHASMRPIVQVDGLHIGISFTSRPE